MSPQVANVILDQDQQRLPAGEIEAAGAPRTRGPRRRSKAGRSATAALASSRMLSNVRVGTTMTRDAAAPGDMRSRSSAERGPSTCSGSDSAGILRGRAGDGEHARRARRRQETPRDPAAAPPARRSSRPARDAMSRIHGSGDWPRPRRNIRTCRPRKIRGPEPALPRVWMNRHFAKPFARFATAFQRQGTVTVSSGPPPPGPW